MNKKIHLIAQTILDKLSKSDGFRFNELLSDDIESEHLNYYLKKLQTENLIVKKGLKYILTDKGKNYVGLLDEKVKQIEQQAKISILLNVTRKNSKGEIEHLVCKRLKQPYMGKIGRLTGKVKFGETIHEAAFRELKEETNLDCELKDFNITQIYHKIRNNDASVVVQDNIFFICNINYPQGDLVNRTDVQENFWLTKKEFEENKELDFFDDFVLNDKENIKPWFFETVKVARGY